MSSTAREEQHEQCVLSNTFARNYTGVLPRRQCCMQVGLFVKW